MATRSTLALLVVVLTISTAVTGNSDSLPRPWLSLDREAKLLHLTCKPPPESSSSSWTAVHDLRLTAAFQEHHGVSRNISLVTLTPILQRPRVIDGFIYNVSFLGNWSSKDVALNFLFRVSEHELGSYYCTVGYDDHNRQNRNFTTRVTVNETFLYSSEKENVHNFQVRVIDAHEVNVTWTKPKLAKLKEASVTRILVDAKGNDVGSPTSLFTTNGVRNFVYDDQDVLITRVNSMKNDGNFSLSLYVKAKNGSYRYSCDVPYPNCAGQKAVLCTCCVSGSDPDPDRQKCPVPQVSRTYFSGFVFCLLLLSVVIVGLSAYCLYKKNDKCSRNQCLVKFFAPKREPGSPEEKKSLKESTSPNNNGTDADKPPVNVSAKDNSESENKGKMGVGEMLSGATTETGNSCGQSSHSRSSQDQSTTGPTTQAEIHSLEGAQALTLPPPQTLQAISSIDKSSPNQDAKGASNVILEVSEDDNCNSRLEPSTLARTMQEVPVQTFTTENYSDRSLAPNHMRLLQEDKSQPTTDRSPRCRSRRETQ